MKIKVFGFLALAMLAMYYSYDYGVSITKLAYSQANDAAEKLAENKRVDQAQIDSNDLARSIKNTSLRKADLLKLQKQVVTYEKKLQKSRAVSCNWSASTVVSMREFAGASNNSQQLGAGP